MNKKPNTPLVKFKNFNSVWISDQVKNLFDISRGQFLTKDQIKSRPVERERERERERADTSTRFIHHKQKITGF
ncbi:hypothetical protein R7W53_03050 [Mesomycoplasma ovipneumoniae]|uniref:hypothetical protein n=1 Tax=Mesomycoplasma ovipneumoniae TaxID=29562 RepID=UPI0029640DF8|nr:hypothetical protein [Mesomycoplasma ovipneumoniae]MDW2907262.1 hypothetical protein [Mesomycoplasma ovipneumoniae]